MKLKRSVIERLNYKGGLTRFGNGWKLMVAELAFLVVLMKMMFEFGLANSDLLVMVGMKMFGSWLQDKSQKDKDGDKDPEILPHGAKVDNSKEYQNRSLFGLKGL